MIETSVVSRNTVNKMTLYTFLQVTSSNNYWNVTKICTNSQL